jgi:hypothetical protein
VFVRRACFFFSQVSCIFQDGRNEGKSRWKTQPWFIIRLVMLFLSNLHKPIHKKKVILNRHELKVLLFFHIPSFAFLFLHFISFLKCIKFYWLYKKINSKNIIFEYIKWEKLILFIPAFARCFSRTQLLPSASAVRAHMCFHF